MQQISGSDFGWLAFDKNGVLSDPAQADALKTLVARSGVTDLVVLSHGWKNSPDDALRLYTELWTNTVGALQQREPARIIVAGVLWPAKAFDTTFDDFDTKSLEARVSDGTLSVEAPAGAPRRDITDDELRNAIAYHATFLSEDGKNVVAAAEGFIGDGRLTPGKSAQLFKAAERFLSPSEADPEIRQDAKPLSAESPQQRLLALSKPPMLRSQPGVGAAMDLGNVVGNVFAGPRAAVARFLNQLTYFEMKKRAGVVGKGLGSTVLPRVAIPGTLRLHLVGHSFGARLVTAAVAALPKQLTPFSLTLLQGAFSHNALAEKGQSGERGAFADVVGRPTGPISMTHTHNDEACTFWYAIASRLSRDATTDIGDQNDMFGAMGANGPQRLDAGVLAKDVTDTNFHPVGGKVNRFLADGYILKTDTSDAHNNVTNPTVGKLLASVLDS